MCQKTDGSSSKVLSKEQQKMIFVKRGIVVPAGSRCCSYHLYDNHLTYDALQQITHTKMDMVSFDANGVAELITDCCATIRNIRTLDFDDPTSLDDESYYNMTGLERRMNQLHDTVFLFLVQINLKIC